MNRISATVIIICFTIILFSCNSQSTDQKIIGKWSVDQIEKADNTDTTDIAAQSSEARSVSLYFTKDGVCYSTKQKIDTLEKGKFELAENGKYIILHINGITRPDTLEIKELKGDLLKVLSAKAIVTLKKAK
jgi:hypothetical protein